MANLKEVKERIGSVTSTQQITKAMKMVAAAKLRRAQDRIIQLRPYSEKLAALLANVADSDMEEGLNTFGEERDVHRVLLVPITSDRGLCGAFNANIIKATRLAIGQLEGKTVEILPIGKRLTINSKRKAIL